MAASDANLMRRVQADDIGAFEALYDRHSPRALGLARLICRDSDRAEEAVQDGFLAVWRSRSSYDPSRGTVPGWLLMVIRHCSIDAMRRARRDDFAREFEWALGYLHAPGSVSDDAERHHEAEQVRRSLRELPVGQREVIALAYFSELTHTEIAARLQLPTGTVKGRMRLGLDRMRAEVNGDFARVT